MHLTRRVTSLVGGLVLDGRTSRFLPADLVIDGRRVRRLVVRPADGSTRDAETSTPRPTDPSVVDASGLYLLPGLIDCHVHLVMRGDDADPSASAHRGDDEIRAYAGAAATRTIAAGVTTVRDVGGWHHVEMDVRRAIEEGAVPGPTLLLAGRLLSVPTPAASYYPGMYETASGIDQLRAAAERQLARGADLIKIMATGAMLSPEQEDAAETQLSASELQAVVEVAGSRGKPVAAHAHALEGIRNAVEAGVASIEHGTFADEEVLERMAAGGVFLVPTIAASASLMKDARVMKEMPAHLRERLIRSHERHVATVHRAYELGVPLAMGTDAGTPGNHHGANAWECVHMVNEAGLPAAAVVDAATRNAARLLLRDDLGTLEAGTAADVIGVAGDPLEDMTQLTRVVLVIKNGEVIRDDRSDIRPAATDLTGPSGAAL